LKSDAVNNTVKYNEKANVYLNKDIDVTFENEDWDIAIK
jgi:hypothetical protein